jgi:hypothetical protein
LNDCIQGAVRIPTPATLRFPNLGDNEAYDVVTFEPDTTGHSNLAKSLVAAALSRRLIPVFCGEHHSSPVALLTDPIQLAPYGTICNPTGASVMKSYFTHRFEMPSAVMPTIETVVAIGTALLASVFVVAAVLPQVGSALIG